MTEDAPKAHIVESARGKDGGNRDEGVEGSDNDRKGRIVVISTFMHSL